MTNEAQGLFSPTSLMFPEPMSNSAGFSATADALPPLVPRAAAVDL